MIKASAHISPIDHELARLRCKIELKYANDKDMGYMYILPNGESMPLTPFMMKEWARAMVCQLLSHANVNLFLLLAS